MICCSSAALTICSGIGGRSWCKRAGGRCVNMPLILRARFVGCSDDDENARKFVEEDIDQILERRTQLITQKVDGQPANQLSKASFVAADGTAC